MQKSGQLHDPAALLPPKERPILIGWRLSVPRNKRIPLVKIKVNLFLSLIKYDNI
jgi:hypothetical protein